MTTYFVDPISGNNANAGTSYATAVQNLNATALAVATDNDEIRILGNEQVSIYGNNAKWNFQIATGNTAATITAATNTSPIQITVVAHGFSNNDWVNIASVLGNTNANGEWKITVVDADNFTLQNSSGNAAYTSGGTAALRNGCHIEFSSPQVKNISLNGNVGQTAYPYSNSLWTASANVTASSSTGFVRQYNDSLNLSLGSFTSGKIAYQDLGSAQDFSGFTHICFSFQTVSSATIASNSYYIALCSDTSGSTIVDTFYIPQIPTVVSVNAWTSFVIKKDGGGSLGSSIRSIAIYRTSGTSQSIYISNICACEDGTNKVNLRSLISLEDTVPNGDFFGWYSLASINESGGVLNFFQENGAGTNRAFYSRPNGTGTFKTKKIDPFDTGYVASSSTPVYTIGFSGTSAPVTIRGGYSAASNMSTITSISAFCSNGLGYIFNCVAKNYIIFENICSSCALSGFYVSNSNNITFKNCYVTCTSSGINANSSNYLRIGVDYDDVTVRPCYGVSSGTPFAINSCSGAKIKSSYALSNINYGIANSGGSGLIEGCTIYNNSSYTSGTGILISGYGFNTIKNCDIRYSTATQLSLIGATYNKIENCTLYGNLVSGVRTIVTLTNSSIGNRFSGNSLFNGSIGYNFTNNCSSNDIYNGADTGISVNTVSTTGSSLINVVNYNGIKITTPYLGGPAGTQVSFTRCTDDSGNPLNGTYGDSYQWVKSTDYTHGSTISSWAVTLPVALGSANSHGFASPVCMPITTVPCYSGVTYTFKAWVLRADAANLTGYLLINGGCALGITSDIVSANTSAAAGVWEQLSVSFSTTTDAIVTIYAAQYGYSTSSIYWVDTSLTQV